MASGSLDLVLDRLRFWLSLASGSLVIFIWAIFTEFLALLFRALSLIPHFNRKWGLSERLNTKLFGNYDLWIHGASIGECKACANAIHLILLDRADLRILLTTQTKSAFELMTQTFADQERVCVKMYPLDRPRVMRGWIQNAQIKQIWLYESELWPGLLWSDRQSTSLLWISARMGNGFMRVHQKFPRFWRKILLRFDRITSLDPKHPAFESAPTYIDPIVWDFKNLVPLPLPSSGAAKCLLSWHQADLEFAEQIVNTATGEWYLQARFLDALPAFRSWAQNHDFEIVSWPLVPSAGQVCLVEAYGITDEVLQRCDESWIGGGFHEGGSSQSPRESFSRGLRTWVGPYLSAADPLILEWVNLGFIGQYGVSGSPSKDGRQSLEQNFEIQHQNLKQLLNQYFPKHQNI